MIIIPEIKTVVILVPRTGSGSLRRAIAARYPKSMMLYRHMEADGVPQGFDRYEKVGVIREPLARLWSLYKFLRYELREQAEQGPGWISSMRGSVDRPFEDWLLNNEVCFSTPYDSTHRGSFYPQFTVRHPIPENRKSQYLYLRPDLGTTIYSYYSLENIAKRLDVRLGDRQNATRREDIPDLSPAAVRYLETAFAWDLSMLAGLESA